MRSLHSTLLFCLATLLCCSVALADGVGSVTSASGGVSLLFQGKTTPVAVGQSLVLGDELDTSSNGRVEFQLADGTIISLTPGSRFVINQYDYDDAGQRPGLGLFNLFTGGMRAITGAISRFQHRVEVTTPVATIGIRGTEFVGEIGDEGMDVSMLEGQGVFVRNPQGDQVELNQAGHTTHLAFHRLADGRYNVEKPLPPRFLRKEELDGLQHRVDWMDHHRVEHVRAMRTRFERLDRAHGSGPFQRGPRFDGGRLQGGMTRRQLARREGRGGEERARRSGEEARRGGEQARHGGQVGRQPKQARNEFQHAGAAHRALAGHAARRERR